MAFRFRKSRNEKSITVTGPVEARRGALRRAVYLLRLKLRDEYPDLEAERATNATAAANAPKLTALPPHARAQPKPKHANELIGANSLLTLDLTARCLVVATPTFAYVIGRLKMVSLLL